MQNNYLKGVGNEGDQFKSSLTKMSSQKFRPMSKNSKVNESNYIDGQSGPSSPLSTQNLVDNNSVLRKKNSSKTGFSGAYT